MQGGVRFRTGSFIGSKWASTPALTIWRWNSESGGSTSRKPPRPQSRRGAGRDALEAARQPFGRVCSPNCCTRLLAAARFQKPSLRVRLPARSGCLRRSASTTRPCCTPQSAMTTLDLDVLDIAAVSGLDAVLPGHDAIAPAVDGGGGTSGATLKSASVAHRPSSVADQHVYSQQTLICAGAPEKAFRW